jgi:hypothetical protein
MRLEALKKRKEHADWLWNITFERAKSGEASQLELINAMTFCNSIENEISIIEWREYKDKTSKESPNLQKYFKGYGWYRPEDSKLFLSNGEKFISQTLPYEAISFEQMDEITGV